MADWINLIARKHEISNIEIDILNNSITPEVASIKPLLSQLDELRGIIDKELIQNGFNSDYIKRATLKFEIPINSKLRENKIYCYPELEDITGKIYKAKKAIEETPYEIELNENPSLLNFRLKILKDLIMSRIKK